MNPDIRFRVNNPQPRPLNWESSHYQTELDHMRKKEADPSYSYGPTQEMNPNGYSHLLNLPASIDRGGTSLEVTSRLRAAIHLADYEQQKPRENVSSPLVGCEAFAHLFYQCLQQLSPTQPAYLCKNTLLPLEECLGEFSIIPREDLQLVKLKHTAGSAYESILPDLDLENNEPR
eukprot:TRINITY_DN1509_c0_g1_i1.p1 TRINITY_DN1509_c0_g1~~TRINITY_DN1509_c0_g1_i1.p1  ORF type:complete len:189 (-),score=35.97 TRINITY_DN1509_c0_g1_i1:260-784(-)